MKKSIFAFDLEGVDIYNKGKERKTFTRRKNTRADG
jgi:hypothetical protein